MKVLVYALMCFVVTSTELSAADVKEDELLSILLAKKARWDENSKTLQITGAGNFEREDLLALRDMPSVKRLQIAYTLQDEDLVCLRDADHLNTLVLTGNQFTDKAILHVAAIPSVTTLQLENSRLTVQGIETLSRMKHLDDLSLVQLSLPAEAIAKLKKVPSLKILKMRRTSCITGLSGCKQLRILDLGIIDQTTLSEKDLIDELRQLSQLDTLRLSVTADAVLPSSALNDFSFSADFTCFVPTNRHPFYQRLMKALPKTTVSVELENRSLTFQGRNGHITLTLK